MAQDIDREGVRRLMQRGAQIVDVLPVLGVRARGCEVAREPTALRVHGLWFRLQC